MMIRFPMIFPREIFFFQDPPGKQQDKNIGGSINHRSEFHIHFGVAPGIQE